MAKGGIVNQKVTMLDQDMMDLVNGKVLKRKEIMGALGDYLKANDLVDPNDGRYFTPDAMIKDLLKEIRVKPEKRMMRGKLLKLFGNDAREAGLVDY